MKKPKKQFKLVSIFKKELANPRNQAALDVTICDEIKPAEKGYNYRTECYRNIALRTNDSSICLNIADDYGQFSCIGSLSVKKNNQEMCNSLKNEEYKNKCIQAVVDPKNQNARLGLFV